MSQAYSDPTPRQWTNDDTMTAALWLADNARHWVAQRSREIFDAEDLTQEMAVIQRNTAAKLATEIEEGIKHDGLLEVEGMHNMEEMDYDIASLDFSLIDYLQIATRLVDNLDYDTTGGN